MRAPRLAAHANAPRRPAVAQRDAFRVDQRFGPDPRTQAARDPDPKRRLAQLDRDPDEDRDDPEVPRQDEDRQEEGDYECDR